MDSVSQSCDLNFLRMRGGRTIRAWAGWVLAATIVWSAAVTRGQPTALVDIQREYDVKGAYLYSFTRYFDWPETAFAGTESPFVIGVLGEAPIGRILARTARTKRVGNRPIVVKWYNSPEEYQPCHLLFMVRTVPEQEQRDLILRLKKTHVLLVGETPEFARWGGIVNFYLSQDTVRFEINVQAAKREDLAINAKLLRIGRPVGDQ